MFRFRLSTPLLFLLIAFCGVDTVYSQNLEPRRWSHLPTGLNIVAASASLMDGHIYFDPVMQIEDGKFELYTLGTGYIRTFEWLGRSSRIDFTVPYAYGRWDGLVEGVYTSIRRHGFADPRIRLSMKLLGSPPLKGRAFMDYRVKNQVNTSVGIALSLSIPTGEYYPELLINLGRNRYAVRPSLGILHTRDAWEFELTGSLSLFSDNDAYFPDHLLEQDPLWFIQGHVIRSFTGGKWVSFSAGFSYGGEAHLDGRSLGNTERTRFVALSYGMPLSRNQSIKFSLINAETNVILGTDSNALAFSWNMNWGSPD